jgi:hypothetical protein
MYFYSGPPMHFLSGVDTAYAGSIAVTLRDLLCVLLPLGAAGESFEPSMRKATFSRINSK